MQPYYLARRIYFFALIFIFSSSSLYAHCQIPCGIYGDQMRIEMLKEDVRTIEKSMSQIIELSQAQSINFNQLVRWVNNKEEHAQKIQDIVTAYFLTQRVKPVSSDDIKAYKNYSEMTVTLQQILVFAMKAKQTTELKNCTDLLELIDRFSKMYFSPEDLKHLQEHK